MPLLYGDLVCLVAIVKGCGTMLFAVTLVVPGEVFSKSRWERPKLDRWARAAAQLRLVSAEPAPAPALPGWRAG